MTIQTQTLQTSRSLRMNLDLLFSHRELIFSWVLREMRARYRQSVLGFGWALVQPVVQMVVISVIFGAFLRVPSEGIPYPVFAYVAILPWTLFAGSLVAAVPSIIMNMDLVTKIYFPREIIPISAVLARLVDFAIASIVFVGLMIWYQVPIHSTTLFVPVLLVIQLLFTIGVGLLGAAITVFIRDISFAIPVAMQLWMYACPVIYPSSMVPEQWKSLYFLNPMAVLIESYRQVILFGELPDFSYLALATGISLFLFIFGYINFKRVEMAMADII